jgi:hypothetical protein
MALAEIFMLTCLEKWLGGRGMVTYDRSETIAFGAVPIHCMTLCSLVYAKKKDQGASI